MRRFHDQLAPESVWRFPDQLALRALRGLVALTRMMLALDSTVEKLGSWSEGCSCHENMLLSEKSGYKRQHKLRRLINGSDGPSALAGECWR